MINVDAVLDRVTTQLKDKGKVHWLESELLADLADGVREVTLHKPEAASVTAAITLAAGDTRQALPAGYIRLMDVVRNLPGGEPVSVQDRQQMDLHRPGWHGDRAAAKIRHVIVDEQNPRMFWVWPKPNASRAIEAILVAEPPEICAAGASIALDATLLNALVDFVLYRAWSKDAEEAGNAQLAIAYYQAFGVAIGLADASDVKAAPVRGSN